MDWVLRIFGTQVTEKKRSVRPVFLDYLSVSYDYDKIILYCMKISRHENFAVFWGKIAFRGISISRFRQIDKFRGILILRFEQKIRISRYFNFAVQAKVGKYVGEISLRFENLVIFVVAILICCIRAITKNWTILI